MVDYCCSFQQIGEHDLPAFIDYILILTNQEKLFYVGHAQGTTSYFALTSVKTQYNDKIRLSVNLSPIAYCSHQTSFLNLFAAFKIPIEVSTTVILNAFCL